MKKKTGSNVKATCSVCGKVVTKAGLIGHMAWAHGKDNKRPLLPSKVPANVELRRKAKGFDYVVELFKAADHKRLVDKLETIVQDSPSHDAFVASLGEEIRRYALMHKEPVEEVSKAVTKIKKARITELERTPAAAAVKRDRRKRGRA